MQTRQSIRDNVDFPSPENEKQNFLNRKIRKINNALTSDLTQQ